MQPDISVVVPIYGVEKYLKQCVDSILNQTFKNMEVILVDDGSRDRCPQMVDEYAAQDARVVAIHQPNGGYGKAVNAGIARARGKYIGIIESDDWIAPDMYEKLFAQAEKTGAEITKGNFYWVTNSAKGEMFLFKPWTELAKCGEVFTLEEKPNLFMDHSSLWSALYRRDFLEKHHIRFQESAEACYQDWPFCADVYSAAESITMLPEPFVYYRNDTDNTNSSSQVRSRKLIKIIHQALCARDILIANKAYGQGVREAWSKQAYVASRSFFDKIADEALDALVRFRFKGLTLSIDGATQAAYEKYRVGGCLDRVFENVRKLNELKRKYNSPYPKLSWQFIIFGHNEREIPLVKKMAPELGFSNVFFKLNYDGNFSPVEDVEFVKRETGLKYVSRAEYLEHEGKSYSRSMCMALWKAPAINWDGRLLGCCNMYKDDFGVNVFECGLEKALGSRRFREAQKMLLNFGPETDNPCVNCQRYKIMKETKSYLTLEEIEEYKK